MSTPIMPFWFKQRQCVATPAGEQALEVSGPNLPKAFLRVWQDGGKWRGGLKLTADGEDVATADADKPGVQGAWDVAFELYRLRMIV